MKGAVRRGITLTSSIDRFPIHKAALQVMSGGLCSGSGIESSHLIEIPFPTRHPPLTIDRIDVALDFCLRQQLLIRVSLLL